MRRGAIAASVVLTGLPGSAFAQTFAPEPIPIERVDRDVRLGVGAEAGIGRGAWGGGQVALTARTLSWLSFGGEGAFAYAEPTLGVADYANGYVARACGLALLHTPRALFSELSLGANFGIVGEWAFVKTDSETKTTFHVGPAGGPIVGVHVFPYHALSIDFDVGGLLAVVPRSDVSRGAGSLYARLGGAWHFL